MTRIAAYSSAVLSLLLVVCWLSSYHRPVGIHIPRGAATYLSVESSVGYLGFLWDKMEPEIPLERVYYPDPDMSASIYRLAGNWEWDRFSYDLRAHSGLPARKWSGTSVRFPYWFPVSLFTIVPFIYWFRHRRRTHFLAAQQRTAAEFGIHAESPKT